MLFALHVKLIITTITTNHITDDQRGSLLRGQYWRLVAEVQQLRIKMFRIFFSFQCGKNVLMFFVFSKILIHKKIIAFSRNFPLKIFWEVLSKWQKCSSIFRIENILKILLISSAFKKLKTQNSIFYSKLKVQKVNLLNFTSARLKF